MKALIDLDPEVYGACYSAKDGYVQDVYQKLDERINKIIHGCGSDSFQGYLTGGTCWRREKYSDYKGSRKSEKPEFYQEARGYLVEEYDAIVTDDSREADDWIGEMMKSEWVLPENSEFKDLRNLSDGKLEQVQIAANYVACSSDKDFNTFAGWHYNPKWDVKYWVSEEDANTWFWCQMVIGDTVDNIKGVKGKGKAWVIKHFPEAQDLKLAVIALYREVYGEEFEGIYKKNFELLTIGAPCE